MASVDGLTSLEVEQAINKSAEARGRCAGSLSQGVVGVRAFLRYCDGCGYIADIFDIPYHKVSQRLPRPIARHHVTRFLDTPVVPYQTRYLTRHDEMVFRMDSMINS